MPRQLSARRVAVEVLRKIDVEGAYANIELDKQLRQSSLDARDRALTTELVYGTLRWQGQLDMLINKASSRPLNSLKPVIRNTLRITVYQLMHLSHIPAHAAVHEAVELVRDMGQLTATGFVNAIARRLAREGKSLLQQVYAESGATQRSAMMWSHPEWLVERWQCHYGADVTQSVLEVNQAPASCTLRVNTLKVTREDFLTRLTGVGVSAYAGSTPDAVVVNAGIAVNEIPCFHEGWFTVQDASSQLVAYALNPSPGEAVADLCSAPGGKATHLAQLMQDTGELMAVELHPHRARLLQATARRMGIRCMDVVQADSRQASPKWQQHFDRVLVDAPCTGTGVLRRRVDLRWRLKPEDIDHLKETQQQLLETAATILKPGGRLVYSTCSIEPEENKERIASFLAQHPQFMRGDLTYLYQLAPQLANPHRHPDMAYGELQLLPSALSDGFFIALLVHKD